MKLPSVYVIGDSISIDYGRYLEQFLKGMVLYGRKEGEQEALKDLDNPLLGANGGDSSMVGDFMKLKIDQGMPRVDLLVVNCGLHDIKSDPETGQLAISDEDYKRNLESIVSLYPELATAMLWVRTTPIDDARHAMRKCKFGRLQKDVDRYNAIADRVMMANEIPMVDLSPVCVELDDGSGPHRDGVHFVNEVKRLQGAYLAGRITGYFARDTV